MRRVTVMWIYNVCSTIDEHKAPNLCGVRVTADNDDEEKTLRLH